MSGDETDRPPRVGDLELVQDLDFERSSWRVQKTFFVLLPAIIVLAALGLFGTGPLSKATAGEGGELEVGYERFTRLGAQHDLQLRLGPGLGETARVGLSAGYLEDFEINSTVPGPVSSSVAPDEVVYTFSLRDPGMRTIRFRMTPRAAGIQRARVRLVGGPSVSFTQVTYP